MILSFLRVSRRIILLVGNRLVFDGEPRTQLQIPFRSYTRYVCAFVCVCQYVRVRVRLINYTVFKIW